MEYALNIGLNLLELFLLGLGIYVFTFSYKQPTTLKGLRSLGTGILLIISAFVLPSILLYNVGCDRTTCPGYYQK